LATLADVPQLDAGDLAHTVRRSLVIDTRPAAHYRANHVYGTVNIPIHENSFNTWLGWYVDYDEPVYLIAEADALPDVVAALRAIGVDQVGGWFAADAVRDGGARLAEVDVRTAAARQQSGALILDVRGHDERREQHIPGSLSMPMGDVLSRLAEIPRDRPVIVQCGGGARSGVVASLLEKHGYEAINLRGGIDAWERAGLPLARGE
jgi:hydroxyacylglutathione hydrolase